LVVPTLAHHTASFKPLPSTLCLSTFLIIKKLKNDNNWGNISVYKPRKKHRIFLKY
jgi:hypothetical protein